MPYARVAAIGVGVVSGGEGKGSGIVTEHPAVVGKVIAVGSERDVNGAIEQHQAWPVKLPQSVEMDDPANTAVAGTRDRRPRHISVAAAIVDRIRDHHGAAELFGSAGDVQSMQSMNIMAQARDHFLGFGFDIDGAGAGIDDGRAGDADLGLDIAGVNVAVGDGGHASGGI